MKIEVTKVAELGQVPQFKLFIDGNETPFKHEASRLITNTTNEADFGIFSATQNPWFSRGDSKVTMGKDTTEDIPNCSPFGDDDTAQKILDRIVKAKEMIEAAFLAKYPATKESASIVL